jgi:hypothetical protein
MTNTSLVELILEALKNASENGYENSMNNIELANDLQRYDADIEQYSLEQIVVALEEIRSG